MLLYNEGVPRSGKSYDAVETHILPALKKGRKVFARLNGLNHELIAKHLEMRLEDVQALLVHVPSEDMPLIHQIAEPNSLVIIDECHDFYPQNFKSLPQHVERFFAEHGHHGMDILFMSQFYKRLHNALRARVERKTSFQKLTAVGMKGKYLATYYHTVAPDKFEKTGKKTKAYDPAIFPLYAGFAPGTENTEVYEEGGMNVWASVAPWLILAAVLLLAGGFFYAHFFTAKPKAVAQAKTATAPQSKTPMAATGIPVAAKAQALPSKPKRPDMPPEAAYVWGLSDQGKPRLAALVDLGGDQFAGVIEWRADQSRVIDRLTVEQVRALGVAVIKTGFGVKLVWGAGKDQQTMIVTSWPIDDPNRYSQQQIADIRDAGPRLAGGSEAASHGDPVTTPGGAARSWSSGIGAPAYQPPGAMPWNSDPFGGGKAGR